MERPEAANIEPIARPSVAFLGLLQYRSDFSCLRLRGFAGCDAEISRGQTLDGSQWASGITDVVCVCICPDPVAQGARAEFLRNTRPVHASVVTICHNCALRSVPARNPREQLPLASSIALAGLGFYGIAGAHDHFAEIRARQRLVGELSSRGVPRTSVMAGFEYDDWTQVTTGGFFNDPRVHLPPGTSLERVPQLPFKTEYFFWPFTPVVRPDYVVSMGSHPDLMDTDLPGVAFDCWLPPFRRVLIIQTSNLRLRHLQPLPLAQIAC